MMCLLFHPTVSSARGGREGFSLLEVMIAFVIFALVMGSVIWTLATAQRMGQAARNRIDALQQARASLEELFGQPYDGARLNVGTANLSRGGMTGRYVVTETVPNQMKRIVLSYDYPAFGRTANLELQAEISNALH